MLYLLAGCAAVAVFADDVAASGCCDTGCYGDDTDDANYALVDDGALHCSKAS